MTPGASGSSVRQLLRVARAAGVSPAALGAAGWDAKELSFEDRIPEATVLELWRNAATLVGRTVPLLAAQVPRKEHRSLALYACLNMPTVHAMLGRLVEFAPLLTSCEQWNFDVVADGARLVAQSAESAGYGGLLQLEFHVLDMALVALSSDVLKDMLLRVQFAHECPASEYAAALGVPVDQCAQQTTIELDASKLERRFPDADPGLNATLVAQLDAMLEEVRSPATLVDQLEAWIAMRLPNETTLDIAARGLGVSQRTLQRRLAQAKLGYRETIDRVRYRLARQWLRRVDLQQVAERLGYSDSRALRRAFRRWSGVSPREWIQSAEPTAPPHVA